MAKSVFVWKCLRCGADAAWINHNRTRCMRCNAGREWLDKVVDQKFIKKLEDTTDAR